MTALQQFWYSKAAVGPVVTSTLVGNTVTVVAEPDGAVAWLWTFSDGSTSTLRNPPPKAFATFPQTIRLVTTYRSADGCREYQIVTSTRVAPPPVTYTVTYVDQRTFQTIATTSAPAGGNAAGATAPDAAQPRPFVVWRNYSLPGVEPNPTTRTHPGVPNIQANQTWYAQYAPDFYVLTDYLSVDTVVERRVTINSATPLPNGVIIYNYTVDWRRTVTVSHSLWPCLSDGSRITAAPGFVPPVAQTNVLVGAWGGASTQSGSDLPASGVVPPGTPHGAPAALLTLGDLGTTRIADYFWFSTTRANTITYDFLSQPFADPSGQPVVVYKSSNVSPLPP